MHAPERIDLNLDKDTLVNQEDYFMTSRLACPQEFASRLACQCLLAQYGEVGWLLKASDDANNAGLSLAGS